MTRNKVNTWLNKFNPYNPYMRMIFIYLFLIKWSEITTFLCSPCCSKQVWRWIISLLDLFRNSKPQNRDWLELSSVWQTCTIIYANPWGKKISIICLCFGFKRNKVHLKDFKKKNFKNSTICLDERGGERSIGKGRGRV